MRSLQRWMSSGLLDVGARQCESAPLVLRKSDSTDAIAAAVEAMRAEHAALLIQRVERGRAVRGSRTIRWRRHWQQRLKND